MSSRAEVYRARLKELGWTEYKLVAEVVKLRQARGEQCTATRIRSSIVQALHEPDRRATYLNDDIVAAMNGEIVIRWRQETINEVKL